MFIFFFPSLAAIIRICFKDKIECSPKIWRVAAIFTFQACYFCGFPSFSLRYFGKFVEIENVKRCSHYTIFKYNLIVSFETMQFWYLLTFLIFLIFTYRHFGTATMIIYGKPYNYLIVIIATFNPSQNSKILCSLLSSSSRDCTRRDERDYPVEWRDRKHNFFSFFSRFREIPYGDRVPWVA